MINPYFKSVEDLAFQAAAVAINNYMAARPEQETINPAELVTLSQVQDLQALGIDLSSSGAKTELKARVDELWKSQL